MKLTLTLCALAICSAFILRAADEPKKPGGPGGKPKMTGEEIFKKLDTNGDGSISKDEFMAGPRAKEDPAKAEERFKMLDKNSDGKITLEEFKAAAPGKGGKGDGKGPKKPEVK
jgi:hypothetical protein